MAALQSWEQSDVTSSEEDPTLANPGPSTISRDRWERAERRTVKIMGRIQPTTVSETRRKAVIDYIQRLIRGCLGVDVFPFGSVPLKTYLPDGDIDLSAFGTFQNAEEALANDIYLVLKSEEQNKGSEFEVRDAQYINAEVKLVKCLVQNIVIDISVNQLGGLCTLCFLEQIDKMIAKQHLFKRSIILIKAWCYYESRILGAHHGLISTYALETLVLYIFQHFHSCLHGPLEVLYRFLDYFSKFDWDNYCVSLNGRIPLSALPEMAVEATGTHGDGLLLSQEFLKECAERYSVPTKITETVRSFHLKHLNIVDPLKENNNLGRSVSRGSFYRIRSAFMYGRRKLEQIFLSSEEVLEQELTKFFVNTLDRHECGGRPDVQDPNLKSAETSSGVVLLKAASNPHAECGRENHKLPKKVSVVTRTAEQERGDCGSSHKDTDWLEIDGHDSAKLQRSEYFNVKNASQGCFRMGENFLECDAHVESLVVSRSHLLEDTDHLASKGFCVPSSKKDVKLESGNMTPTSLSGSTTEVPHLRLSHSSNTYPGYLEVASDPSEFSTSTNLEKKVSSWLWASHDQFGFLTEDLQSNVSAPNVAPHPLESSDGSLCSFRIGTIGHSSTGMDPLQKSGGDLDAGSIGAAGGCESVDQLPDLTGDFDSHEQSLACGRWCYESALFGPFLPFPAVSGSFVHHMQTYDGIYRPSLSKHYQFVPANGVVPGPHFSVTGNHYYSYMKPPIFFGGFNPEDSQKMRGTGTYLPNMCMYGEKQPAGRGRHRAMPNNAPLQRPRVNGSIVADASTTTRPRGARASLQTRCPSEPPVHEPPSSKGVFPCAEGIKFGSLGPLPWSSLQRTQKPRKEQVSVYPGTCMSTPPAHSAQRLGPDERLEKSSHSYLMKDEDFPPLSV